MLFLEEDFDGCFLLFVQTWPVRGASACWVGDVAVRLCDGVWTLGSWVCNDDARDEEKEG